MIRPYRFLPALLCAVACFSGRAAAQAEKAAPAAPADDLAARTVLSGVHASAYVQTQYESHEDSEDQVRQGGQLINRDRFVLRRARLKVTGEWTYSALMVELDGNTVRGPSIAVHHAEASLLWRGGGDDAAPPVVKLSAGLLDVPFGQELVESPRDRFFVERGAASRAFFPGEPDMGARLSGQLGWLRYAAAITNGQPRDERTGFTLEDPNGDKDLVARLGAELSPSAHVHIAGGISVLNGTGFHRGKDATKSSVVWKDINENGQIDGAEISVVPGSAATPSENFDRWAIGADYRVRIDTPIGQTALSAELVLGTNMDRNLFVADPVLTSLDAREVGYAIGLTQAITPYAVLGFRLDSYDPNADFLDRQGGEIVASSERILTASPLVGLVLPERARLVFQYDLVRDKLARDGAGLPTDLANDAWTLRLQGNL